MQQLIEPEKDISDNNLLLFEGYKNFFNSISDFLFVLNPTGCIIEVNTSVVEQLGYAKNEIIGKSIEYIHPKNRRKEAVDIVNDVIAGKRNNCHIPIATKQGVLIPVETSVIKGVWNGKEVFFAICRNISKVVSLEERYAAYFANSPAFSCIIELKGGCITEINNAFINKLGYTPKEVIGKKAVGFLRVKNSLIMKELLLKNTKVSGIEIVLLNKAGQEIPVLFSSELIRVNGVKYLYVIGTDVADNKQNELHLKEQSSSIKNVIQAVEGKEGQEYYNSIVKCLSDISKSNYTFIGSLLVDNKIGTIALWANGELVDNIVYDFKNAPCYEVVGKETSVFKNNVTNHFPEDQLLIDMGIEAYIGAPIFDNKGNGLGILVSLYTEPIIDTFFIETIFELFASSIGNEMKRTKADIALKESQLRYKLLSEATFEGIVLTKDGQIVDANEQILKIYGYNYNDISNTPFQSFFHPEDYGMILKRVEQRNTESFNYRGITKNGKVIYLDVHVRNIVIEGVDYRLSVLRDITKQKKQELEIQDRGQLLRTVFDNTPTMMLILDEKTEIEQINKFGYNYFDKTNEVVMGQRCGDVLSCIGALNDKKGLRDSSICKSCVIRNASENTLETGIEHLKLETDIVTSINEDLSIKTFLTSTNLIEQNGKRKVLLTLDDITERKQMEEELVISNEVAIYNENRYKLLTDLTFEGIILHRDGIVINVNKSFSQMSSYTPEELVGLDFTKIIIPEKYVSIFTQKLSEEYSSPYEIEIQKKDGSLLPVEIEARYFTQNNSKIRVSAVRDVSERKQLEQKILNTILETEEKERASFAQELHDGLGPILSNVKMYFQWLAEADENREFVTEKGNKSLQNAIETLREISSKLSPHILHNFGLGRAVHSFIEQIPRRSSINIIFENSIGENRYHKNIEIALYRVLTELVNNTIKYAEAKSITIQSFESNKLLCINYSDDGKGIDFNTINEKVKGFGLFNMQSRIKNILGSIEFKNGIDNGLIVTILVPKGGVR